MQQVAVIAAKLILWSAAAFFLPPLCWCQNDALRMHRQVQLYHGFLPNPAIQEVNFEAGCSLLKGLILLHMQGSFNSN